MGNLCRWGGVYQLKCIDDLKMLHTVPRAVSTTERRAAALDDLKRATDTYDKYGWPVAAEKLVEAADADTVQGAEVDGRSGHIGVGRQRRSILMILLPQAARLRGTTSFLLEALLGNITHTFLFNRPLLAVLQGGLCRGDTHIECGVSS